MNLIYIWKVLSNRNWNYNMVFLRNEFLSRVVNLRAGPVMSNFSSIRIFEAFLKEIWTLSLTRFKLSIVLSKNGWISAKSSRNIGKKRPGPAHRNFGPERPGPVHLNLRAGTARNGPARPNLSSLRFITLFSSTF